MAFPQSDMLNSKLSYVSALVNLQTPWPWVRFVADITNIGSITRMDELMCFQVTLCNEFLLATFKSAHERPFTSLCFFRMWKEYTWVLRWVLRLPVSVKSFKQSKNGQFMCFWAPFSGLILKWPIIYNRMIKLTFIEVDADILEVADHLLPYRRSMPLLIFEAHFFFPFLLGLASTLVPAALLRFPLRSLSASSILDKTLLLKV